MSRWRMFALAGLSSLWLAACSSLPPSTAEGPDATMPAERQILVMLRLPPPHFRPEANYTGAYDSRAGRAAQQRIAQALAGEHGLKLVAEWPMPALGVDCFVMELQDAGSATRLVEQLSREPVVESVQPMRLFRVLGHNDPLYPFQPSARLWHLAEMHEVATGKDVLVAQIDTGVDVDHPDLAGRVTQAQNFVDGSPYAAETHGTAVAGIIAARADDRIGIAGVAPQARLMALRACWELPAGRGAAYCSSFTLAKALQFALDQHAQVINMSLGGPIDRLLERLIDAALAQGATVIGAIDPQAADGGFPASHGGVLAVASEETREVRGDALLAPGRDVPTTVPGGRWQFVAGSSFAAAQVTGMVALLRELTPGIQARQIRDALTPASRAARPAATGAALRPAPVDAWAALARTAATCACGATSLIHIAPPE